MEIACYIYWGNSNYCLDDERNISTMDYGLGCRSRKILLLVDNCSAHPKYKVSKILDSNFSLQIQLP